MKFLRQLFDWMDTKAANKVFGCLFVLFTILDLKDGHYWMALFDAIIVVLNVLSLKRKGN